MTQLDRQSVIGKPKILVIEDQPAVAMTMTYVLALVGCDVTTALTGKKGLEYANSGDFDLITLDITLPDVIGFEIYERIRSNPDLSNTPVIFVSGNDNEDARNRARELGAVDFIAKPFDTADFVDRIFAQIGNGTGICLKSAPKQLNRESIGV